MLLLILLLLWVVHITISIAEVHILKVLIHPFDLGQRVGVLGRRPNSCCWILIGQQGVIRSDLKAQVTIL